MFEHWNSRTVDVPCYGRKRYVDSPEGVGNATFRPGSDCGGGRTVYMEYGRQRAQAVSGSSVQVTLWSRLPTFMNMQHF